jgi:hypothetical protein
MSSILNSFDELRPEVSDSELSSTLNTTAFNTASQATTGVSTVATAQSSDIIRIDGRSYIQVNHAANIRAGS